MAKSAETPANEAAAPAKEKPAPKAKAAAKPKAEAKKAAPAKKEPAAKPEPKSKLAEFLRSKKIDPRWLLVTSRRIERLRPEDRALRRLRRLARTAEGEDKPKELPAKPRSGRPVTHRALEVALHGGAVQGPVKTRILRAVNHVLEQKKTDKVELRALF